MDNQLLAQTIVHNNLVSKEQINSLWGQITAEKDIGMILVENTLLTNKVYNKLVEFVNDLDKKAPTKSPIEKSVQEQSVSLEEKKEDDSNATLALDDGLGFLGKIASPNNIEMLEDIELEPENPYGDFNLEEAKVDIEEISGLVATSIVEIVKASSDTEDATLLTGSETDKSGNKNNSVNSSSIEASNSKKLKNYFSDDIGSGALSVKVVANLDEAKSLDEALVFVRNSKISYINLSPDKVITASYMGNQVNIGANVLSSDQIENWINNSFSQEQIKDIKDDGALSFIYVIPGSGRFRVSAVKVNSGTILDITIIDSDLPTIQKTKMPNVCAPLLSIESGLLVFSSPSQGGKTIASTAWVNYLSSNSEKDIYVVDSPVEFIYKETKSKIYYREVGSHTKTLADGLNALLRIKSAIIVTGVLDSPEVVMAALKLAEAGHLVCATIVADDSIYTIENLISCAEVNKQEYFRDLLANNLKGVISQHLIPAKDNNSLIALFEVMNVNTEIKNQIKLCNYKAIMTEMDSSAKSGAKMHLTFSESIRSSLANMNEAKAKEVYKRFYLHKLSS